METMEWKWALTVGRAAECGVGACIVLYLYLVSAYRPSNSPLPESVHFILSLFNSEGDQELNELLFIGTRPLLAMRPAGSGGEGQRLTCPVEVKVRRGRVVYRGS